MEYGDELLTNEIDSHMKRIIQSLLRNGRTTLYYIWDMLRYIAIGIGWLSLLLAGMYALGGFCYMIIYVAVIFPMDYFSPPNSTLCRSLDINNHNPIELEFNPDTLSSFQLTYEGRFDTRDLIFKTNSNNNTNIVLSFAIVSMADGSNYDLNNEGMSRKLHLTSGSNSFWRSERCGRVKVEILFPPFFDNQPNRNISFDASNFNVTFALDNLPYIPHNLKLISHDSYINLQNTSIQSMEISASGKSQIIGNAKELNNSFIALGYNGYIGVNIAVGKNNSQPYIDLESESGSISLNLNDTFAGEYDIFSNSGRVSANNADNNLDSAYSGNTLKGTKKSTNSSIPSNGIIIAKSNSGDVKVDFLYPLYTKVFTSSAPINNHSFIALYLYCFLLFF
ncbi:hypothetical protein C2G38_149518 [Gigaspora rosea]|uniref:Uncharacterized protein n=1 Tax=Gigaspora rosea TaxID=44941 RepID=A0A397W8M8_9GLOM|nr:hypothetical protein C2G38_149518 [Gigaspora rosea]CAG8580489.1 8336_t:CDS:2 [Gigaspora rosea]